MIRLHSFWYSPYVAKVRKCLELKGLAFEVVEVPYLDRRELCALTRGYIHVPVLEDGAKVVTDSARIAAYLDEAYAPSLREDPVAVVVEQWAEGPLEDAAFRVAAPGMEDRFAGLQGGREDARAIWRLMKERRYGAGALDAWRRDADALGALLEEALAPVVAVAARRPFFLGDAPTLADAALYGQLFMLEAAVPGWLAARAPTLLPYVARVAEARAARRAT
ncbi:MAG TPA: glutathione S-transferase family protein [Byssovorax sp.]|jgi:glutathione S-transferase